MRYLVLNRPTGADLNVIQRGPDEIRAYGSRLKELIDRGVVESLYHIIGGGHMYIISADSTEDLLRKVRKNPLYEESHTQVIPLADIREFMDWYAEYVQEPTV